MDSKQQKAIEDYCASLQVLDFSQQDMPALYRIVQAVYLSGEPFDRAYALQKLQENGALAGYSETALDSYVESFAARVADGSIILQQLDELGMLVR